MMLTVVFWDVQHGSAAYIRTPTGRHIVIDLGVGSYGGGPDFSPLLYLQHEWGVERLDGVVLTHPHRDHLDDICNFHLLAPRALQRPKNVSEQDVRDGNRPTDKEIIDKYLEVDRTYCHPVADADNPFHPANNGGVSIQSYHPSSGSPSNLNNRSIVTVVSYGGIKIVVPGDNEAASWDALLQQSAFVAATRNTDILVASHHGRESGFSPVLVEHMSPKLTIISDGRFVDTSATSRYSAKTSGLVVTRRSGATEQRKCVTTRTDGAISVGVGGPGHLAVAVSAG